MKITVTSKRDLAQAYFPLLSPKSAMNKLMSLINDDPTLMPQLLNLGYNRRQHYFTPMQTSLICERLGLPY